MVDKKTKRQPYINIFDDLAADWEAIVNARDTERETNFIQDVLPKKGMILDLCCGTGRHSIILRRKGWNIIGLDLSKNLLNIAKRNMKKERAEFAIVRADMRHFPFREQNFDAAISMFTSFGYLPSENEDIKSLKEVHRTLRKGGKFLLDVANRDHVVKIFQEREWAEFDGFYMLEKRSLDLRKSMLTSEWTIIKENTNEMRTLQHTVRLYTFSTLEQMLAEAGLTVKDVYGGYDGKEFSLESSRMIMLAEKRLGLTNVSCN